MKIELKNLITLEKYEYNIIDSKKTEKGILAYLIQSKYLYNHKKMLGLKIPSNVRLKTEKGIVVYKDGKKWKKAEITDSDGIKVKSEIANKKLLKFLNKNV